MGRDFMEEVDFYRAGRMGKYLLERRGKLGQEKRD